MAPVKDLEEQEVEEVMLPGAQSDDLGRPDPRPEWWGPEQESASRSRTFCICGHEEREHCVPKGEDPRECIPEYRDHYDETGEPVLRDHGCACLEFQAASSRNLAFAL
jgi:hypothetical protein